MSQPTHPTPVHCTPPTPRNKPAKPSPAFPLFAHATGRWAKKIDGKTHYFGRWDDPEGALREFDDFLADQTKPAPSRKVAADGKPGKPYDDFPLFPHAVGQWAKKIRGRMHYFGPWHDPEAAVQKYLDERDDLHAGRKPRGVKRDGLILRDLCNRFLTAKKLLADSGEITPRTWADYHATCGRVVEVLGRERRVEDLAAEDFEQFRAALAKDRGPVTLGNDIRRVRVLFKYGFDAGLMDRPVRFGPSFRPPSRKILRKARADRGKRMFEADELRRILDTAGTPLRAMILLGINCGLGNADVGLVPLSALDLEKGWLNFPRPKTGVERRCPLWPETVAGLREATAARAAPKDPADADLAFITKYGGRWHKGADRRLLEMAPDAAGQICRDNPISKEFAKVVKELELHRAGLNFYALRHTFATMGAEARDQAAVDLIMGHARDDMASVYRERISDERLQAVVDYVRAWLFPQRPAERTKPMRKVKAG
jgi:integrase